MSLWASELVEEAVVVEGAVVPVVFVVVALDPVSFLMASTAPLLPKTSRAPP
jgi:hypothetical protein